MKSVLVIGMGRFGRHLAYKMLKQGNDVMIVDRDENLINELASRFTDSLIGDCTKESVIRALGVKQFDLCVVSIGEDFQSSLVITSLLKRIGARYVVAKANQEIQAELLETIGADEVVYPDRDLAERLAVKYSTDNVFDYNQLTDDYSICEVPIPSIWEGHSIYELDIRRKYKVNVIAVKEEGVRMRSLPDPDYIFKAGDHVVVIGKNGDALKLSTRKPRKI